MAVISVREKVDRRRSSCRDGKYQHARVFLVITDSPADGTAMALTADGIPGPGDAYHGVPFSGKDAEPVQNSPNHFEVSVDYASSTSSSSSGSTQQNDVPPLEQEPEVSYGSEGVTEEMFLDADGHPLTNSAGERFESTLEKERGITTITVVKNLAFWNPSDAEDVADTVNREIVILDGMRYAPGTLRLAHPTAQKHTSTISRWGNTWQEEYYRATFTFHARKDGWGLNLLDVGFNELYEKQEYVEGVPVMVMKRRPILEAGSKCRLPWPLDGEGHKMPSADDPAAILHFTRYPAASWAIFGF
ncbi:MAG: hypothetical protein ACM359_00550 [Bacillota bacterium]